MPKEHCSRMVTVSARLREGPNVEAVWGAFAGSLAWNAIGDENIWFLMLFFAVVIIGCSALSGPGLLWITKARARFFVQHPTDPAVNGAIAKLVRVTYVILVVVAGLLVGIR